MSVIVFLFFKFFTHPFLAEMQHYILLAKVYAIQYNLVPLTAAVNHII